MTVVATRDISQPDRHGFYNAYTLQTQARTAVDILQGVSLVIGAVCLAAPASARIYEAFRINTDRAAALRIYTGSMRGATIEDLEDFMYLLDDTLSGPGVPGMAPGQEWTITYQTVGGAAHQSLLNRLRDRQASYGNFAHYQAIGGDEGAIRIVYDLASGVSAQAQEDQLARQLYAFFQSATPAMRGAAQTSPDYQRVFNDGYVAFTNVRHREGELFFALISALTVSQRSGAAHTAISRLSSQIPADRRSSRLNSQIPADRRSPAESGAIQFMETLVVMVNVYDRIRGQGVGANALTAHLQRGFQDFDTTAKNLARDSARRWRTQARGVVSGATLNHPVKDHLNNNIEACLSLYLAALYNPAQLPPNMHSNYYSSLHTSPSDIWGAYTAILVPTSRQMADSLTYIILASWDPRSTARPPGLARSIMGTLRTLAGMDPD